MQACPDVQTFWTHLSEARQDDDQGTVLTLPDGVFWLGDRQFGNKLFVRPCYPILFDLIKADWLHEKTTLLLGSPGIGKSSFLCYVCWRLSNECSNRTIVLQKRNFIYRFNKGDSVARSDTMHLFYSDVGSRGCYLLTDSVSPISVADGRRAQTLVISFPGAQDHARFNKQEGPKVRYMYPPNWQEINAMRRIIEFEHEDGVRRVVDEEEARERFDKLGGDTRHVLAFRGVQAKRLVYDELTRPDLSYLIKSGRPLSPLFQCWSDHSVRFASHYIRKKVLQRISIRALIPIGVCYLGPIASRLFEDFAIDAICKMESIPVTLAKELFRITGKKRGPLDRQSLHAVTEIGCLDTGVLGHLQSDEFGAVDAVIQPSTLFQMKCGVKGGVNISTLKAVLEQMYDETVHLYFVVFDEYVKLTVPLAFTDDDDQEIKDPPAWVSSIQQHVLDISTGKLRHCSISKKRKTC